MTHKILVASFIAASVLLGACGGEETETVAEAAQTIQMPALADINTIAVDKLKPLLPEAGLADKIIAARPFADAKAMDEFLSGHLSDEAKQALYAVAFIPMNLNTTPEADFQIIPGVGKKMAHEFEEYRPYTDMSQFDREIAKYVDAEELARLRRYVTIK